MSQMFAWVMAHRSYELGHGSVFPIVRGSMGSAGLFPGVGKLGVWGFRPQQGP